MVVVYLAPAGVLAQGDAPECFVSGVAGDGRAEVVREGSRREVEPNEPIVAGDRVITDASSTVEIACWPGTVQTVGTNSEVVLESAGPVTGFDWSVVTGLLRVVRDVLFCTLDVRVRDGRGYVNARTRGTVFSFVVDDSGRVEVSVYEGAVGVSVREGTALALGAGQRVVAEPGRPLSKPRRTPPDKGSERWQVAREGTVPCPVGLPVPEPGLGTVVLPIALDAGGVAGEALSALTVPPSAFVTGTWVTLPAPER